MDRKRENFEILFQGIQRIYRNAVLGATIERLGNDPKEPWERKVEKCFRPEEWEQVKKSAKISRIKIDASSSPVEFSDWIGVNHFYNIYEKYFDHLVFLADSSEVEKPLLKRTVLDFMRKVKDARDPMSHPKTEDASFRVAFETLSGARDVLSILGLVAAAQDLDQLIEETKSNEIGQERSEDWSGEERRRGSRGGRNEADSDQVEGAPSTEDEDPIDIRTKRLPTYCMTIDMIGSTAFADDFVSSMLERFHRAQLEQFSPHFDRLGLKRSLLKFTGDGWILLSRSFEDVERFACLALIQKYRFGSEFAAAMHGSIEAEMAPHLKITICQGIDVAVNLPDGRLDYLGTSARRSNRAQNFCQKDRTEILVDDATRNSIIADFETRPIDMHLRPGAAIALGKGEKQDLVLFELVSLKEQLGKSGGAGTTSALIYTLDRLGRSEEAKIVTKAESTEKLTAALEAVKGARPDQVRRMSNEIDEIIAAAPDIVTVQEVNEKKMKAGLEVSANAYNRLIRLVDGYDEACKTYEEMVGIGVQANLETYKGLVARSENADEIRRWKEKASAQKIQLDADWFELLMDKAPDYAGALEILGEMPGAGIGVSLVIYNKAFSKVMNFSQAEELIQRLNVDGLIADSSIYNIVVGKAPRFESGLRYLEMAASAPSEAVNVVTYNIVLNKAPDLKTAKMLFDQMRAKNIAPDTNTYNCLIFVAENVSEGRPILIEMLERGVPVTRFTAKLLLERCSSFIEAQGILRLIGDVGDDLDLFALNKLIERTKTFSEAVAITGELEKHGVKVDIAAFKTIASKALPGSSGRRQLQGLFEEMKARGMKLTLDFYWTAIGKSEIFERDAEYWFNRLLLEKDLGPDLSIYNQMISKANGIKGAGQWFTKLIDAHLAPDALTFNNMLSKNDLNYVNALFWFERMKLEKVEPNGLTYSLLLIRASYLDACALFQQMVKEGKKVDVTIFRALVDKAPDFVSGMEWFDRMSQLGQGDPGVLVSLFKKDLANVSGKEVLDFASKSGFGSPRVLETALAQFMDSNRYNDACYLCLMHPYLDRSMEFFAAQFARFESFVGGMAIGTDMEAGTVDYALGIANKVAGNSSAARRYLQNALQMTDNPIRIINIEKLLDELSSGPDELGCPL